MSSLGSLFGAKPPKPQAPPPPPKTEDPAVEDERTRQRKAALYATGRTSLDLTGGVNLGTAPTRQKTLLGQ